MTGIGEATAAPGWTVCQIGARENYAVARALGRAGRLERLVTDLWSVPGSGAARIHRRLGERFHPEISPGQVKAATGRALLREVADRVRQRTGWTQIMARNAWFQSMAVQALRDLPDDRPRIVFAYSYAAGDILAYARTRGWRTVLGQIDPGPVEARLVEDLYRAAGDTLHAPIPTAYWEAWHRETELADRIIVNSPWSQECLEEASVPGGKIDVVPLAYDPAGSVGSGVGSSMKEGVGSGLSGPRDPLPAAFTPARPLRLLFLGQVTLRKGIDLVLEAMWRLSGAPVRLDIVGPVQIDLPDWVASDPRITFHGSVARSRTADFYARADLFLFPTRSDGFGLTQLEALAAGLPVIASTRCGAVVVDGKTGRVLPDLVPEALTAALADILSRPDTLAAWRRAARIGPDFGLDALAARLTALEADATANAQLHDARDHRPALGSASQR